MTNVATTDRCGHSKQRDGHCLPELPRTHLEQRNTARVLLIIDTSTLPAKTRRKLRQSCRRGLRYKGIALDGGIVVATSAKLNNSNLTSPNINAQCAINVLTIANPGLAGPLARPRESSSRRQLRQHTPKNMGNAGH